MQYCAGEILLLKSSINYKSVKTAWLKQLPKFSTKNETEIVVFFYCRAKTNTQIANSANIGGHDLARREEAKDQNKNVA